MSFARYSVIEMVMAVGCFGRSKKKSNGELYSVRPVLPNTVLAPQLLHDKLSMCLVNR